MDSNISFPAGIRKQLGTHEYLHNIPIQSSEFFKTQKSKQQRSKNYRMNFDGLSAFLQSSDGLEVSIEKLLNENISYEDLASLTNLDLELFGYKNQHERENLLKLFAQLPNQDPTFDTICNKPEGQMYNSNIFDNVNKHLENVSHALMEANYKLQISYNVPDDIPVGDKYFASRFAIEVLDKLNDEVNSVEREFNELSEVLNVKPKKRKIDMNSKNWLILAGLTAISIFWYFKAHLQ